MRAVTIASPEFEELAFEAAHRFWLHTGIDVDVLRCSAEMSHRVKLELCAMPQNQTGASFSMRTAGSCDHVMSRCAHCSARGSQVRLSLV